MPVPNFPDAPLVHLSFDLRERTPLDPPGDHALVAQCNFQHEGGTLTSFDPEQLPKFLQALMGAVVVTQADTLAKQAALIAANEAELKAKDANAQELLEQNARLQVVVGTFREEVAPTEPRTSETETPGTAADSAKSP